MKNSEQVQKVQKRIIELKNLGYADEKAFWKCAVEMHASIQDIKYLFNHKEKITEDKKVIQKWTP